MERTQIEDMEEWLRWKKRIVDAGFMLWQTQYGCYLPEGLTVGFMDLSGQRLEILTHNEEIAEDIESSGLSEI